MVYLLKMVIFHGELLVITRGLKYVISTTKHRNHHGHTMFFLRPNNAIAHFAATAKALDPQAFCLVANASAKLQTLG